MGLGLANLIEAVGSLSNMNFVCVKIHILPPQAP
jgi:hypothetical protein